MSLIKKSQKEKNESLMLNAKKELADQNFLFTNFITRSLNEKQIYQLPIRTNYLYEVKGLNHSIDDIHEKTIRTFNRVNLEFNIMYQCLPSDIDQYICIGTEKYQLHEKNSCFYDFNKKDVETTILPLHKALKQTQYKLNYRKLFDLRYNTSALWNSIFVTVDPVPAFIEVVNFEDCDEYIKNTMSYTEYLNMEKELKTKKLVKLIISDHYCIGGAK